MKAFFQAARPPLQRDDWSLEDRARFNGLSEGYLLQFLSENKGALTTARRLGFTLSLTHSKPHQSLPTAAGGKAADATHRRRAADATPATSKSNKAPRPRKATRHAEHPKSGTSAPNAQPHAPTAAVEDEAAGGAVQDADAAPTRNSKQRRAAKRSARHHTLQLLAQKVRQQALSRWRRAGIAVQGTGYDQTQQPRAPGGDAAGDDRPRSYQRRGAGFCARRK